MSDLNYQPYLYYSTYIDGVLKDFGIPCFEYKCPVCYRISSGKVYCAKCNTNCEKLVCQYIFINNQVYKRCISPKGDIYYIIVIDNFKSHDSPAGKGNNIVSSSKKYYKQLTRDKTVFYYDEATRRVVLRPYQVRITEENLLKQDNTENENEKEEEKKEMKIENTQTFKPKGSKTYKEIQRELNKYKMIISKIENIQPFIDIYDDADEEFRKVLNMLCKYPAAEIPYIYDSLLECDLFNVDEDLKNDDSDDTKRFFNFCYEIVHNYALISRYLEDIRSLIRKYQDTEEILKFYNKNEINFMLNKFTFELAAKEYNDRMTAIKFSAKKHEDKVKYVVNFYLNVIKPVKDKLAETKTETIETK